MSLHSSEWSLIFCGCAMVRRLHDLPFPELSSTTSFITSLTRVLASKFKSGRGPRPLSPSLPALPSPPLKTPTAPCHFGALGRRSRNIWALIWGVGRDCGRPQLYWVDRLFKTWYGAPSPGIFITVFSTISFFEAGAFRFFHTSLPSLPPWSVHYFFPQIDSGKDRATVMPNIHSDLDSPIQAPLKLARVPTRTLLSLSDSEFSRASCVETKGVSINLESYSITLQKVNTALHWLSISWLDNWTEAYGYGSHVIIMRPLCHVKPLCFKFRICSS